MPVLEIEPPKGAQEQVSASDQTLCLLSCRIHRSISGVWHPAQHRGRPSATCLGVTVWVTPVLDVRVSEHHLYHPPLPPGPKTVSSTVSALVSSGPAGPITTYPLPPVSFPLLSSCFLSTTSTLGFFHHRSAVACPSFRLPQRALLSFTVQLAWLLTLLWKKILILGHTFILPIRFIANNDKHHATYHHHNEHTNFACFSLLLDPGLSISFSSGSA